MVLLLCFVLLVGVDLVAAVAVVCGGSSDGGSSDGSRYTNLNPLHLFKA